MNTNTFQLDPTLPWLFSDRTMQEPAALQRMFTMTLNDKTFEPMGQYFPGGTTLAMRRVTSLDQLTVGAVYYSESTYWDGKKTSLYHRFGRYVGLENPESKGTARRWKKGEAHITLECDVLDCDLHAYHLREDGTETCYVQLAHSHTGNNHKLYQITHYVHLPAPLLAELGPEAIIQSGLTLRQACFLRQEKELTRDAMEITAHMQGGFNLPDYRVVLPNDQLRDLLDVLYSLPTISAGQASRVKSGTMSITVRHSQGGGNLSTYHYKLMDAVKLLDWLRHHSDVQDAALNATISRQGIEQAAEAVRAKSKADRQARAAAQLAEPEITQLLMPQQNEYADMKELAHAA